MLTWSNQWIAIIPVNRMVSQSYCKGHMGSDVARCRPESADEPQR